VPNYPYISGPGPIVQTFSQLRKGFPGKVDAGYLQRFKIAPANESYVISILRSLGLIDEEGNRVEDTTGFFYGNDDSFKSGLEGTLRKTYAQVFDEMGDAALEAPKSDLAHWFRAADKTSELVGQRQAMTFQTLVALAGHGDPPNTRSGAAKKTAAVNTGSAAKKTIAKKTAAKQTAAEETALEKHLEKPSREDGDNGSKNAHDVGLTVRIEVNLPPGGDADTYDAIFASIRKHLMS
jgi:Family of unknown function (DUF5343)